MYKIIRDIEHQAKNIHWLEFELSNNCQYASQHKWCPRYYDDRELTFLSTDIIKKVVQFFKQYDFFGRVFLSGYSEPLIDPRLVDIIKYIKRELPKSIICMFSNGIAADEILLREVLKAGVSWIKLSTYNEGERKRLEKIANKVPGAMLIPRKVGSADDDIDERIYVYDKGVIGCGGPCYMPTLYYFVRNNGDVNMCFWDWRYTQIFGNLYKDSVESTLMNERRLEINRELTGGNRAYLDVCNACKLPHYRCTREYREHMKL